ncbi:unnamed protein product [Amoebophrya sp. A25]|nr:unnamed protein product [Amoebophrya sp. A25]|eukprot:GSA25T00020796001.1
MKTKPQPKDGVKKSSSSAKAKTAARGKSVARGASVAPARGQESVARGKSVARAKAAAPKKASGKPAKVEKPLPKKQAPAALKTKAAASSNASSSSSKTGANANAKAKPSSSSPSKSPVKKLGGSPSTKAPVVSKNSLKNKKQAAGIGKTSTTTASTTKSKTITSSTSTTTKGRGQQAASSSSSSNKSKTTTEKLNLKSIMSAELADSEFPEANKQLKPIGELRSVFLSVPQSEWPRLASTLPPETHALFFQYTRECVAALEQSSNSGPGPRVKDASGVTQCSPRSLPFAGSYLPQNPTIAHDTLVPVWRAPPSSLKRAASGSDDKGSASASPTASTPGGTTSGKKKPGSSGSTKVRTSIPKGKGPQRSAVRVAISSGITVDHGPEFLFGVDLDAVVERSRGPLLDAALRDRRAAAARGAARGAPRKSSGTSKNNKFGLEDGNKDGTSAGADGAGGLDEAVGSKDKKDDEPVLVAAARPDETAIQELREYVRISLYVKGDDEFQFEIPTSAPRRTVTVNAVLDHVVSFSRLLLSKPASTQMKQSLSFSTELQEKFWDQLFPEVMRKLKVQKQIFSSVQDDYQLAPQGEGANIDIDQQKFLNDAIARERQLGEMRVEEIVAPSAAFVVAAPSGEAPSSKAEREVQLTEDRAKLIPATRMTDRLGREAARTKEFDEATYTRYTETRAEIGKSKSKLAKVFKINANNLQSFALIIQDRVACIVEAVNDLHDKKLEDGVGDHEESEKEEAAAKKTKAKMGRAAKAKPKAEPVLSSEIRRDKLYTEVIKRLDAIDNFFLMERYKIKWKMEK